LTAEQTKIAEESHVKAPWLNVYGVVPPHLDYPDCTMYEAVERCAETYPNHIAYVFMGRKTTYRAMAAEIDLCARALKATGVRPGDRITMAMPNCPQAVIMFYAINLVGATANMIHPLSSEKEIEFYLKESGSIFAVTLDQFYHKFEAIRQNVTGQHHSGLHSGRPFQAGPGGLYAHRGPQAGQNSQGRAGAALERIPAPGPRLPLDIPGRAESRG